VYIYRTISVFSQTAVVRQGITVAKNSLFALTSVAQILTIIYKQLKLKSHEN